ncbi:Sodium/potassium-transporting ATPase subunit alpha-1, partial [Aphanomyces cochlioides]
MSSNNRRSSAEIVAVSTEMRHRQAMRKKGKGKSGKDDDNKRELEMDEHKKSVPELCADLTTSVTL